MPKKNMHLGGDVFRRMIVNGQAEMNFELSVEVIAQRDAAQGKTGYDNEVAIHAFDCVLKTQTLRLGYWPDTSDLSVSETVDLILDNFSQTVIARL